MTDLKNPHEELTKGNFVDAEKPFDLFDEWLEDAKGSEMNDPNALALSTVDPDGLPNVRMVLLKGFDETGFVFYTNLESAKGHELLSAQKAAMCFHWKSLRRQVRIRGEIVQVSDQEADEYYQSRPRGSRIGAWASKQSRPLESRFALEKEVAKFTAKFGISDIPRPDHWSGLRLVPSEIEFWADRPFRLHDRVQFTRSAPSEPWSKQRLYP
ncbi:pyridoxamine 5'-phosphate oxidase [Roseibium sp.]|uniref:pyridoxamine 5'-phosphate oxidase n=1 Tax=Roseibium sp. TaxID=1936156 RepID=UPI003B51BEF6